jgi:[NiFe] hydrogenase assembly HybE family chaperone
MSPHPRAAELEACFRRIADTRMAGLPFLHPGLAVQAVGFSPEPDAPAVLAGVLVTPWFMNLVRLPVRALDGGAGAAAGWLAVGAKASRPVGALALDFIGGREDGLGVFESASLFSPMQAFADQAAAVVAAQAALDHLRQPEAAPVAVTAPTPAATPAPEPPPSRRGFLFGRARPEGTR